MEDNAQYGEVIASWRAPAFHHYRRGRWWYVIVALIAIGLLVYAFATANFLFAVLVVMFGMIVAIQSSRKPEPLDVTVTNVGVLHGSRFIPYKDLKSFWIIYDPPVKTLYLDLKKAFFPDVSIPLEDADPLALREILMQFLPEDGNRTEEPMSDLFARIFKI